MHISIRNLLIGLFTTGLLVGFVIMAMDALSAHNSALLESTSQSNLQAQADGQLASGPTAAGEESSASSDVPAMISRIGVVVLIIMLVFFAQMGIAWMLRKPVEAVRW